jgi:hypothetical protein
MKKNGSFRQRAALVLFELRLQLKSMTWRTLLKYESAVPCSTVAIQEDTDGSRRPLTLLLSAPPAPSVIA